MRDRISSPASWPPDQHKAGGSLFRTREQRTTLVVVAVGAVLLALVWGVSFIFGTQIISAVLEGRVLGQLGRIVRIHMNNNPEHADPGYYVDLASSVAARAFFLWGVLGALLVALQHRFGDLITDFMEADGDARTLALTRIVVFSVLALSVNVAATERLASQPAEMLQPPRLMGWLVGAIPISATTGVWAARLLIGFALAAAVGLFTRVTSLATVLLAVYVFGLPQFFGKISHGMHGLLWIAMILAASPCAASWSLDRLLGRGRSSSLPQRGRASGLPIRMIWFLFACIYFFPGAWKFLVSGWDWALSENLKFKMYSTWLGQDFLPAFRIDRYPVLYQASALLTILWELAFPILILFRKTRVVALIGGAVFHLGVWEFMRIGPPLILFGYVAFVDWGFVADKIRGAPLNQPGPAMPWAATRIVGGAVCALVFLFGLTLTDSWPFSVYPTHAGMRGPTYRTLELQVESPGKKPIWVETNSVVPVSSQSVDFAVLAAPDTVSRNAFLRGMARTWAAANPSIDSTMLSFYRSTRTLDPDRRSEPPIARELLLRVPVNSSDAGDTTTRE